MTDKSISAESKPHSQARPGAAEYPTPWKFVPEAAGKIVGVRPAHILDANGYPVVSTWGTHKDAMPRIVRAVNSFDSLLEACKQAELQIEYMQSKFKETGTGNAVIAQCRAAIKAAEAD